MFSKNREQVTENCDIPIRPMSFRSGVGLGILVLSMWGCSSSGGGKEGGRDAARPSNADGHALARDNADGRAPVAPGEITKVSPPPSASQFLSAQAELAASTPTDAQSFLSRWQPKFLDQLPYDPSQAVNLSVIQGSTLKLNDGELAKLSQNGLVISARQSFGTFFLGYLGLYANHLPLFVSGDSVLHAVHRSYDSILKEVEQMTLQSTLQALLGSMQTALASESSSGSWPKETLVDVDEYLAVALDLGMSSGSVKPVAGGSTATISSLVDKARAASEASDVPLFGQTRMVDFSQFKPRGHYAGTTLEPYFRCSMWLGRTDLRLVSQDVDGAVRFDRRQFAAALLMAKLVQSSKSSQDNWRLVDRALRAFVGESDNMTPADFATLQQTAGAASLPALLDKSDEELAQAIVNGGFGIQRIASQMLWVAPGNEGAPLDRAFLLLGQRFVIDSQVLSNVVYDRVTGSPYRMMPNPLDVAFAAFGNSGAVDLLASDLSAHPGYPQALHQARVLVDEHESDYWTESLYSGWLGALRAASPAWDAAASQDAPPLASTKAWDRRVLQMQLASWAELRHDNVLYAKQSYTGMPACEFPDAYVEPIPALWQAIAAFGRRGVTLVSDLGVTDSHWNDHVGGYFDTLANTATMLATMASQQEQGIPYTADQLAFIDQAVEYKTQSAGCTTVKIPSGWYPQLFYDSSAVDKQDTLVVDVHTQPADESGNPVGKVLHVATGFPRLMVTTFNTCSGPRAYAGVVSAYYETTTDNFQRLTDDQWTTTLQATPPPAEVSWMSDLVVR